MATQLWELLTLFLKLGLTSFGGPAVYIALMEDETVRRRAWLSREHFLDLLSATYLIPGPNAVEMACHIGYVRAGLLGMTLAGVAFTLPAAVISGVLAWGYVAYGGLPDFSHSLAGIKPVVIALLLAAIYRLARTSFKTWISIAIAGGVCAAALMGADEVLLLIVAAIVGALLIRFRSRRGRLAGKAAGLLALGPMVAVRFGAVGATAAASSTLAAATASVPLWKLGLFFLKIGAVLYGGGYVLAAYMQGGLVNDYGWLRERQVIDAVAAGQITPGPFLSTATFVGYLLAGVPGALVSTVAIALPSFVFVGIANPWVARLRSSRWASALLDAVNAASLGLMAAVLYTFGSAALTDWRSWTLAVIAAALCFWRRVAPAWLILGGALLGWLLALGPDTQASPLHDERSAMDRDQLRDRFLRYVCVDTTARDGGEVYPSSPGQLELGRLLRDELQAMGLADVRQDQNGIVLATLPATIADREVPTIAFCAHVDTSPETTGANVRPQVIENYPGGDIRLRGDPSRVIRTAENPELERLRGKTLVTSDGTTLLGADDKSGVAVIMEVAAWLSAHPEIAHGPIRICFTCDEEIGRGVDKLDLREIGAKVCYTLDGQGQDEIDVETFSADAATVTVHGKNIHPSIAKGRMINAIRVAADFVDRLPHDRLSPETTEGREGFLHPFELGGGVAEVRMRVLLRDFRDKALKDLADMLQLAAAETKQAFPGAEIDVNIKRQYRNLADGLAKEPRAVEFAQQALKRLNREAKRSIVRGGTDGSRLTELGLPTPNLSCGEHNPHSPLEWTCLEEMQAAVEWLVSLAEVWAEQPK